MDHEIEVSRIKGTLEATKHYYAVLIAKNVEKVERILESTKEFTYLENELDTETTDEIIHLRNKAKRAKSKKLKDLYLEIAQLKQEKRENYVRYRNHIAEIAKNLRQVL